jgi:hypothetical protein
MSKTLYAVIATLPDEPTTREYIAWLEDGHVDQVIKGGAHSAMIVRLEPSADDQLPPAAARVMAQYIFSTRATFDHYVSHHAPALRAEGQKLFGPHRGIKMERLLGEVM